MSILTALTTFWGGVCSPAGQTIIGLANLGGTTYTAVKASQNSNKLSSLQSTCYGIAKDLKEVKTETTGLFKISDVEDLISGIGAVEGAAAPTTTATTTAPTATTTTTPTQAATVPSTAPTAPAVTVQDNNVPAWAQQLMQQQMEQAAVIKNLMQQNGGGVPAIPDTTPAPAPVDPALMAFLQQQAEAMNKLASAVTALETSITEIEAVIDDADPTPTAPVVTTPPTTTTTTTVPVTPPTPPVGGRG